jgi:hypothetical protein
MSKALLPALACRVPRDTVARMDTSPLHAVTRRARLVIALPALALALLALPSAALAADSVSLTIDDPADGRATQIHVATTAAAATQLFITYKKSSSSAVCAPTASADKGTKISYAPAIPAGTGTVAIAYTFTVTGTYLFCSWLAPASTSPATASAAQPVSIRTLKASLAISASPTQPIVGNSVAITLAGSDEVSQILYAKIRLLPAGGGSCASTASPDKGVQLGGSGKTVSGSFSQGFKYTFSSAGSWLVCGWLANGGSSTPLAAASLLVVVRNPVETLAISSDAPATGAQAGSLVTVKATGISEFGRTLYLRTRIDDGRGCGVNPHADPGAPIGRSIAVSGQYYRQLERAFPGGGSWLVCGWLATSETDSKPLAVASTTVAIAGGPSLAVQRAVRIGRTVILRIRRQNVQSGEIVIVRLAAPGWKGRTRRFTGRSPALTVHMLLPRRPLAHVKAFVTRVGPDGSVIAQSRTIRPRRLG